MSISSILKTIIKDHLEHINEEINSAKNELHHIAKKLKNIELMTDANVFTTDDHVDYIRQYKDMIVQNYELIQKLSDLHEKQSEINSYFSNSYHEMEEVLISQENNHIAEETFLKTEEELYILREIRNFYIDSQDFENTTLIADRIRDLRDKSRN